MCNALWSTERPLLRASTKTRCLSTPRTRGMGTANNALRDFRGRSGPFVARVLSHADATAKAIRPRHGKEAAIPPLRWNKKPLYINML
jgi:hypothetical protein